MGSYLSFIDLQLVKRRQIPRLPSDYMIKMASLSFTYQVEAVLYLLVLDR